MDYFFTVEFRQIRYFIEIHRKGSFLRAASALGLTQPALSRQIALLERELGNDLFLRHGRRLELTEAGSLLLEKAVRLQDLWQETLDSVRGSNDALTGNYRIATGGTIAAYILPAMLLGMKKKYPDVSFQVVEGDLRATRDAVLWGEVEIGILTDQEYHPDLNHRHFISDRIFPVVSARHPLANQKKLRMADLGDYEFVYFHPQSAIRRTVEARMQSANFEPVIAMELRSVDAVIRSVEAGLGIGFVSHYCMNKNLISLPVPELEASREFYFCWRKGRPGMIRAIDALQQSYILPNRNKRKE